LEKNKINKIDISRKDDIINDLKSKVNNLKTDNDKLNMSTNDEQQKLTEEIKKKEKIINTLKRNNETLKKELQLYQNNNNIENKKITSNELLLKEKQIEENENIINKMSTCLRLILKDLSKKYETKKNKINLKGMNNTVKEEMIKLGLDEENVGEFIGGDDKINQASEQIDLLLNDKNKFNSEKTFKLYNTLFENIRELESEIENNNNNNNGLSFNNFSRSGTSNNMLASSGGNDNNYLSGKYNSGINNNFTRGNNNNFINTNLIDIKY
jgi:DNA repair exonuclease SbcCD ATPase subunit